MKIAAAAAVLVLAGSAVAFAPARIPRQKKVRVIDRCEGVGSLLVLAAVHFLGGRAWDSSDFFSIILSLCESDCARFCSILTHDSFSARSLFEGCNCRTRHPKGFTGKHGTAE